MTPAQELLDREYAAASRVELRMAVTDPRAAELLRLIVRATELRAHGTPEEQLEHAALLRAAREAAAGPAPGTAPRARSARGAALPALHPAEEPPEVAIREGACAPQRGEVP